MVGHHTSNSTAQKYYETYDLRKAIDLTDDTRM